MADSMSFPKTVEEFFSIYSFPDAEEVYTNRQALITVYRAKQAFEHYTQELKSEIERYKGVIKLLEDDVATAKAETNTIETILEEKNKDITDLIFKERSNAIIEFAELLKNVFTTIDGTFECSEIEDNIDELMKEMTEVEK